MGASANAGSRKLPEPEINVTPLVDVVLVLLIIFMVIAPALEHGERVSLPAVGHPDKASKAKLDPITLTVTAAGTTFLEKEAVSAADLRDRLTAAHAGEPERRIVVKGDESVRYGAMRGAFATCQDVGFPGVSLQVSEKGARRPPGEG